MVEGEIFSIHLLRQHSPGGSALLSNVEQEKTKSAEIWGIGDSMGLSNEAKKASRILTIGIGPLKAQFESHHEINPGLRPLSEPIHN